MATGHIAIRSCRPVPNARGLTATRPLPSFSEGPNKPRIERRFGRVASAERRVGSQGERGGASGTSSTHESRGSRARIEDEDGRGNAAAQVDRPDGPLPVRS
jgi:hypothetical protein